MENTEKIRKQVRLALVESRLASREKILKSKRKTLHDIVDIGRDISEKELTILADKLKTKSLLQAEDLALLKIAFIQSEHNIVTFLKIKGALHGLVRELSSIKTNFGLLAAECLCNLALGDSKSCLIVAKAAGPYLITILSTFNSNLMATSVWALGNLAGSGEKTWKILHSQGFMSKLLQLIELDNLPDFRQELHENSLYALSHVIRVGAKVLTDEEILHISKTVAKAKKWTCGLALSLFLLSGITQAEKELIENKAHLKCLKHIGETDLTPETITEYTACVRTIANLVAEPSGICALEVFENWNCVMESIQKLLISTYRHLVLEMGWLLGNLVNHPSAQVQSEVNKFSPDFHFFETNLLSKIQ